MNKKVFITTFILFGIMLVGCILAKTVFGANLAIVVENSRLIEIGVYLDNHIWIKRGVAFIFTFITYNLYICAICGKWFLSWKEMLIFYPLIVAMQFAKIYIPTVGMYLDLIAMMVIPFFAKSKFELGNKYKMFVIVYAIHSLSQLLCLYARTLPVQLLSVNSAVSIVFMIDQYIVQIMYYLFGNYMGGNYGRMESTISWKRQRMDKEGDSQEG